MKSFLEYVAEDIISKYGTDLSHTVVVFPNKRASLFLNDHLARQARHPIWSPVYITISELFRRLTTLQTADPIKLVCDLHKSFCLKTGSSETLDKFYGWGQLLISDFDDMDKNMADADRVLANLRDIHELDDISYLTDEQRELLRHFFSNFTEEHDSELKQRFLRLWSHLADIYHDFNDRLLEQGLAYEGALYRQAVNNLCGKSPIGSEEQQDRIASLFPADRYLFVGFNLLQEVEKKLFSLLQKEGKARFYWDFDHYYLQRHEAGHFIAQYLKDFPNELDSQDKSIYSNFGRKKQVTYISAPTEHIQARYATTWLREQKRWNDGRRTAIVLCDEQLLPTIIHSLPAEVTKVNVTTGYPLAQTPIASFIKTYLDLQTGGYSPRLQRVFKRHPYTKYCHLENPQPGIPELLSLLRQIANNTKDETEDPLFQESLFRAYTLVNRINGLIDSGDLDVNENTLQRLIQQIIQQTTIPFHGEPAEGVQIMGVLETRNLDFDHVLLLSCNEGNMPKGINDSSFIPHGIRHAYNLTTIENKVSIYAYYFHRLLQRASDVTILWNSSTEDGQRGEMSRFMLQMMVESDHTIIQRALQAGNTIASWIPQDIQKTEHVMQILRQQFSDNILTPTAINRYMRCPLQFYYRYVAGIKEPDQPDDELELDNRVFGNIFHHAADTIYHQLPRTVTSQLLQQLLKDKIQIERAVDEVFRQELPNVPTSGLYIINREVIIRYLRQLLEIDQRLAPFTILGLECDVVRPLTISGQRLRIGGRIDRLDQTQDGTIRVVDYKTGSRQLKPLPGVESIFDPSQVHNHSDYYLQTFVYADIVSRQQQADGPTGSAPSGKSIQKVVPALLFIQHASSDHYDPILKFGREPIRDIAEYSLRFNELLEQKINEMFDSNVPFSPTSDLNTCRTCPFAPFCRR